MPHLRLRLLGTFEAALDGEPITAFGSDKARALLAYLAVESTHPHRRERLSGMFWPDSAEKEASHNLSQTLLRLRRALREPADSAPAAYERFLIVTSRDIQFNPQSDHDVDVARFEQLLRVAREHHRFDAPMCPTCVRWLHEAADLYRGELLAGFFVGDGSGFGEWQTARCEMLRRQAVEMLVRLAGHHEMCGENEHVLRFAGQLVAIEPWHEVGNLHLMRTLAHAGHATSALERYRAYCRVLAEEFDIGPSAEATALSERLKTDRSGRSSGKTRGGEPSPGSVPAIDVSSGPAASPSLEQDDRRQVTALICGHRSATGCTADPEDLHQRLALCSPACQAILERFGGKRQPHQGDECLVYFGLPQAFEDAARRAVHAGLAMVAQAGSNGSLRVGIHTGDMLVRRGAGPLVPGVVGTVPAVARACQALAEPGTLRITADTERLVRGGFQCRKLNPQPLPGLNDPVEVYQVLGEGDDRSLLSGRTPARMLHRFVGRGHELTQLLASSDEMRGGRGSAFLISGEPGIGKSRLLHEFRIRSLAKHMMDEGAWLEARCSPYEQHTCLWPIIGLLEQLLGFEADDGPEERSRRLDAMLSRCEVERPAVKWLLSVLLGLPTDRPAPKTVTADQQERMREATVLLLQREATRRPLVMVVEDLHWSDTTTLAWLDRSMDALAAVPCLLVLTCRPAFVPPWPPRPNLVPMELGPLTGSQIENLIHGIAADRLLPDEVFRRIVRLAEGTPLFAEELTAAVLEGLDTSTPASSSGAKSPKASHEVHIPATLRDSLMARLDQVGPAVRTAQWAAVLGREFQYSTLRALVPYDEQHLQDDLSSLMTANLIQSEGHPGRADDRSPSAVMSFKHALIQEAAYASLPVRRRQSFHRRVAETLERRLPKLAEERPELLAQHYTHAGLQSEAVDFWLRAGERGITRGATSEALTFFENALHWIDPDDPERRMRALLGHEDTLALRGERRAQEVDLAALWRLAEEMNDDARRAEVQLRRCAHAASQGAFRAVAPLAEDAESAARRAGNLALEMKALAVKAQAWTFSANPGSVRQAVEQILARVDGVEDGSVRALALTVAARYYRESGDLVRSAQLQRQSLGVARQARDQRLELSTSTNLGLLYATLGAYAAARDILETGLARSEAVGDRRLHASLTYTLGYVLWLSGDGERGRRLIEEGLQDLSAIGDMYGGAWCLSFLGCVLENMGELTQAAQHLAKARSRFTKAGMDAARFETQAIEARVALARGRRKRARQMAIEVWTYLRESGPEGIDSPSLTYLCVADVLTAVEPDSISSVEVLAAGHACLMQRATAVTDPELRRSFLENVAENREILRRVERRLSGDSTGQESPTG